MTGKETIFQFKDFDFEEFRSRYVSNCSEQREIPDAVDDLSFLDPNAVPYSGLSEPGELIRKRMHAVQNRGRLLAKVSFVIDILIRRAIIYTQGEKTTLPLANINAALLKAIIGRDYKPIIESLHQMGYIEKYTPYNTGEATGYRVEIYENELINIPVPGEIRRDITKYREDIKQRLDLHRKENNRNNLRLAMSRTDDKASDADVDEFILHYEKSLNKIKIVNKTGFGKAIAEKEEVNPLSKFYYSYLERSLEEYKSLYEIDPQGRFYHILTTLKRELKKYLNFAFTLDCKNSHPALFNIILFSLHNINHSLRVRLSTALHKLFQDLLKEGKELFDIYHYVGKNIRNWLINNCVGEDEIAVLSDDELEYIFQSLNGILWDKIHYEHPELTRDDIKITMFQEVFYSNKPQLSYKKYGKIFAAHYPTVYAEIKRWKSPGKYPHIQWFLNSQKVNYQNKPTAALSLTLMTIEANIFRSALASLYRKRYHAVHIHDCIVIPDTGNKHQPTREEVETILLKEYERYGLIPTLSTE